MTSKSELNAQLCRAVSANALEAVQDLLKAGADVNARTGHEGVPLLFLVQEKGRSSARNPMLELLLNHGADPQAKDNQGNTLLHKAAASGADGMVLQLLEAGIDPKTTNDAGQNPMEAARNALTYQVTARLNYNLQRPRVVLDGTLTHARLFAPSQQGDSPIDNFLTWKRFPEVVAQLARNGEPLPTKADLMAPDKTGTPRLARAILCYETETMQRYLAERGEPLVAEDLAADETGINHVASALMHREKLRPYFSPDYWQNRSKEDMISAYRNLPAEAQQHLGNFHQLVTEKSAQENARQRQSGR